MLIASELSMSFNSPALIRLSTSTMYSIELRYWLCNSLLSSSMTVIPSSSLRLIASICFCTLSCSLILNSMLSLTLPNSLLKKPSFTENIFLGSFCLSTLMREFKSLLTSPLSLHFTTSNSCELTVPSLLCTFVP